MGYFDWIWQWSHQESLWVPACFLWQTSCFAKAHTVTDVFDRYDVKNSIKSAERERHTKVPAMLLIVKTRARLTVYDFTRFAFQGCFGIHVFKCFQFWLWDRAIKTRRLS
jgi:hypothetical protein